MLKSKNIFIIYFKAYDRLLSLILSFISTLLLKIKLSVLGCKFGRKLYADGSVLVRVDRAGSIEIGDDVMMLSRFSTNLAGMNGPVVLVCSGEGKISIGENTGLSSAILSSRSGIKIGKNVKIGCNVRIYDHDFHTADHLVRRLPKDGDKAATEQIVIGDDVFIGANAIILKGARIGDRSIIGAGAVVAVKDIPADSLVVCNPAKVLKELKNNAK